NANRPWIVGNLHGLRFPPSHFEGQQTLLGIQAIGRTKTRGQKDLRDVVREGLEHSLSASDGVADDQRERSLNVLGSCARRDLLVQSRCLLSGGRLEPLNRTLSGEPTPDLLILFKLGIKRGGLIESVLLPISCCQKPLAHCCAHPRGPAGFHDWESLAPH